MLPVTRRSMGHVKVAGRRCHAPLMQKGSLRMGRSAQRAQWMRHVEIE